MISRVLYDKGYSQYVEAARLTKIAHPSAKFMLLGDIDEVYPNHVPRKVVENDVRSGFIEYLGYRPNVKEIIMDCDCIVHPTYYNEGLSRVLMEGLAMRKPIITTDIPGCRETVDDGINGFLCEPRNILSLTECIKKFIMLSPEQRIVMGNAGRIKAENTFDINDVIKTYHSITDKYI